MKKGCVWVVTCVEYSDHSDFKGHVLAVCETRRAAEEFVRADIIAYTDSNPKAYHKSFRRMAVDPKTGPGTGCEWNIEKVELPEWVFDKNNKA
jgi:hypothetical protein